MWFNCIYPQHKERLPSSKITIDPYSEYCGIFHCFGCKRSGTIIDIVREHMHNEFWEAVLWLESRVNEEELIYNYYDSYKRIQKTNITLPEEFDSPSSFDKWPKRFVKYLKKRKVTHFQTLKYNIGYCSYGKHKNMIIVPITLGNKLVTWAGRHIFRKVHSSANKGGIGLFGSNYLIETRKYPAIIVEGWADKIKMENIGYDNVMSIQTNKLMEDQFNYIIERNFPYMIVMPDNDLGGNVLIDSLGKYIEYIPIYIATIESKDPGEATEEELHSAMENIKEWEPTKEIKELEVDYDD